MSSRRLWQILGFRICWVVMLLLDWIPGYCRYYTLRERGLECERRARARKSSSGS